MSIEQQKQNWESKAQALIPNGTQTLSKCPERYVNGVYPKFLDTAYGAYVTDIHGNRYADYMGGLGAILLGYNNATVNFYVRSIIADGSGLMSLPTTWEVQLAESMSERIPCAKKVKFFKTGSEAVSAGVRVARAFTGREKVAVASYHGWHDWYTVSTPRNMGIPRAMKGLTLKFQYNDIESLRDILKANDIAAVVLEPLQYEAPKDDFLKNVVDLAHQYGAVVLFDEIITGYRYGTGGAGKYFGVTPDLATFSKAMGNGFPIAALVGGEAMSVYESSDFFISGTYGSDCIGIAAALGVTEELEFENGAALKKIWEAGKMLSYGFNNIASRLDLDDTRCVGMAPRTMFKFPTLTHKALFWQECAKRGVLFGYSNFVTAAHTNVIGPTLDVCEDALAVVKRNWSDPKSKMEGEIPQEVFPAPKP